MCRDQHHKWAWQPRRVCLWLSVWGLSWLCGRCVLAQTSPSPDRTISKAHITHHVQFLASPDMKGRSGPTGLKAAEYLKQHFQQAGLAPLFDGEFFQPIPGGPAEQSTELGRNVGGWLPGSDPALRDEFIIISAHYDHLGVRNGRVFPGADDNASGVSMMLELARVFAAMPVKPRRSLAFVGFDLEERLLWGSRWFAAHPPKPLDKLAMFVTADMIGRSLGDLKLPTVFVLGSEHAPQIKQTLDRISIPDQLEVARLGIDLVGTRSDYGPFRDRRIPFLFLSTGEHPDYHSVRDVPDRVNYDKITRVTQLCRRIVADVADSEQRPQWTDEVQPSLEEARAVNRITTLLSEQKNEKLTPAQQLLISFVKTRTQQIIERGKMTSGERTWLTRMSQLLLLSVF